VDRSGQKLGLWLLGLIVVAAVVGLIWKLGPAERPTRGPHTAQPPPAAKRSADPKTPDEHRPATLATDPAPGDPVEPSADPETEAAPPLAELLSTMPERVIALTAPCYKGEYRAEESAQRVVFRYTLSFNDGWAYVRDLTMLDSDMDDLDLRDCVLETARTGKWELPGATRHVERVQQTITIADLAN